ncbi:unnamed protein product [Cylindrotheca closterium]|uniref:Uncharacterized protein n=1 Tax=Cylindrotheca closterium TaxID=2856 RepID=A0AAD2GB86_9STRA|nr:unnamed protein product [Cylindrotheca closterium]
MTTTESRLNSQQKFCQLFLLVVLLFAILPESVRSFQPNTSRRIRSPTLVKQRTFSMHFLKSSSLNDMNSAVDVDSALVIPCLDQWVTLPSGEMMGIVYHSNTENEGLSMNDGDVIATSPVAADDFERLQEGMNVATISGTQYALLNRATVEMAQHYNYLLENTDSTASDMPSPPIPTASSLMPESTTADRSATTDTTETPESQDKAKQLLQKVKDAGVSGAISYALWELAFWTLSVPVCLVAYQSLTGHWPDFQSSEDWKQLGGEAFVFVNLARFAVPIRIGLALSTVPWVQTNLVDRFSKGGGAAAGVPQQHHQQQLNAEQIKAMEEYKDYLTQRSPELRQRLEAHHEEPKMSAYEEYEQYRQQRSPELQQQLQLYQERAIDDEPSSISEESAIESYQRYLEQRPNEELQERFQHHGDDDQQGQQGQKPEPEFKAAPQSLEQISELKQEEEAYIS